MHRVCLSLGRCERRLASEDNYRHLQVREPHELEGQDSRYDPDPGASIRAGIASRDVIVNLGGMTPSRGGRGGQASSQHNVFVQVRPHSWDH